MDGLMTTHNADFMHDARFAEAYRRGKATGSWGESELPWRVYVVCWAAEHALRRDGDFVECGVNRGGFARAIIEYTQFTAQTARKFYLVDTFSGFPEELKRFAAKANLGD